MAETVTTQSLSMKTALFVIKDNLLVYEQVVKLVDTLHYLDASSDDLIVIEKPRRSAKGPGAWRRGSILSRLDRHLPEKLLHKARLRCRASGIRKAYDRLPVAKFDVSSANGVETREILRSEQIQTAVFVYYDEIVREQTLSAIPIPLNVHPALLPDFRGCCPLYWQLLHGQKISCITVHKMVKASTKGISCSKCRSRSRSAGPLRTTPLPERTGGFISRSSWRFDG